jgi:membrane-bound lytic murein transglycosylase D
VRIISSKYGVSTYNLKRWNGLKSNRPPVGRRLTIYVDNGGYALGEPRPEAAPVQASAATAATAAATASDYGNYKVKAGDSFYSIAKRYPGYTPNDLMKLNNKTSSRLKVGQYIKVPKV